MAEPLFYIFGVPDGFDMLDGDLAATKYFQSYYNPSKENTKFSIHRNANDGTITYAYLKYNLSSGKGREGSFFGMALVFTEDSCCTDILKLYRLFDTIYEKVILPSGEILLPTNGTSYIQAKYVITRFHEKREYIEQNIIPVFLANVEKFSDTFIPVDESFTSEQPDLGVRVPLDKADNRNLLNLLQRYNRVSVSPDWKSIGGGGELPKPELPVDVLWRWNGDIQAYSLFLNSCYRDLERANLGDAKINAKNVNTICKMLQTHKCPDAENNAILQCYNETKKQYATFSTDYRVLIQKMESAPPPPPPPTPISPTWGERFQEWLEWHKPQFYGAVAGLLVLMVLGGIFGKRLWISTPKDPEKSDTTYVDTTRKNGPTKPQEVEVNYAGVVRDLTKEQKFQQAIDTLNIHKDDIENAGALEDSIYDRWADFLIGNGHEYSKAWTRAVQNRLLQSKIREKAYHYLESGVNKCSNKPEYEDLKDNRIKNCTALTDTQRNTLLDKLEIVAKNKGIVRLDKSGPATSVAEFTIKKINNQDGSNPKIVKFGGSITYNVGQSTLCAISVSNGKWNDYDIEPTNSKVSLKQSSENYVVNVASDIENDFNIRIAKKGDKGRETTIKIHILK